MKIPCRDARARRLYFSLPIRDLPHPDTTADVLAPMLQRHRMDTTTLPRTQEDDRFEPAGRDESGSRHDDIEPPYLALLLFVLMMLVMF